MIKRIAVFTSFVFLIMFASVAVQAKAKTTPIAYGDLVEGEISAKITEINYVLSVTDGDVVVLDMRRSKDSELY